MEFTQLLSTFLPSGLLDHFEIKGFKELLVKDPNDGLEPGLYLYLEEKNQLPDSYDSELYESKGFLSETIIQDFPIRGKALYLVVKRRRWRLKSDPNVVIRGDYSFIAEGVKLTQEVADFLKGTG